MEIEVKNKKESKIGIIDSIDIDLIEGKTVNLHSGGYARIGVEKLHRLILSRHLNIPLSEILCVDHINRNKLDNRRENLRHVSILENNLNKDRLNGRKSFGSTYLKRINKWQSQIKINGKQTYLGVFETEEEANIAYISKAKELGRL